MQARSFTFCLSKCCKQRHKQFPFLGESVNPLQFKVDADTEFFYWCYWFFDIPLSVLEKYREGTRLRGMSCILGEKASMPMERSG